MIRIPPVAVVCAIALASFAKGASAESVYVRECKETADSAKGMDCMEHSDFAMSNGQTSRTQHTHHITLKNAQVQDQNFVLANCPSVHYTPATTTGFAITGLASTTGNGALAPFAPQGQQSELTVCITGSDQVTFSNITLVFPATLTDGTTKNPASGHFGTQPINGVVKSTEPSRRGDDDGRN